MKDPTLFGPPKRKITGIERQKRNRDRFSVYLDGEFAFGLDGELLFDYGLQEGQELSEQQILELQREDERKRIKIQAFRYLANRDHSERELTTKLRKKGFSSEAIEWVLDYLRRYNLVNDRAFARVYARERLQQRPMGHLLLAAELRNRGIPAEVISDVLESAYSETPESELAAALARKKIRTLSRETPVKARKKLADFLQRRGFTWDVVSEVLEQLDWPDAQAGE